MSDDKETISPKKDKNSNTNGISTEDIQELVEKNTKDEEIEEEPDEEIEENEKMREQIVNEIETEEKEPIIEQKYGVINTNPDNTAIETTKPEKKSQKQKPKSPKSTSTPQKQPIPQQKTNPIEEEKNFTDELNKIKNEVLIDEGASVKDINENMINSRRKETFERDEECWVEVTVKIDNAIKTYKARPLIDKVFAFVCQGYDNALKETCFRYIKNITYAQISNFQEFIEKYGCICGEKENHIITLSPYLDDLEKKSLTKPKEYSPKFLAFYHKKQFKLGEVININEIPPPKKETKEKESSDEDSE